MRLEKFSKCALIFVCIMGSSKIANCSEIELTLMHWWISTGEARAMSVITDAAHENNIPLQLLPQENHAKLRESLTDLLHIGQKPDFSQWLASTDMITFALSSGGGAKWPEVIDMIHPQIRPHVTIGDELVAIPIVSHMQNSMFIHHKLLDEFGIASPTNWSEIEKSWERLAQENILPILTSDETWQLRMLFNDIFLGKGGIELYDHFYSQNAHPDLRQVLEDSFDTLGRIRSFQTEASAGLNWADAAAYFATEPVGYFFLGDFAWAEMVPHLDDMTEIQCRNVPSDKNVLIYSTDIFLVFPDDRSERQALQRALAEVVLDPMVQTKFVYEKGGIPVIKDISTESLAPCARESVEIQNDQNSIIRDTPWANSRPVLFELEQSIDRFWHNPEIKSSEITNALLNALGMGGR